MTLAFHRILVATDFGESAAQALEVARRLSTSPDVQLTVVNVYRPPLPVASPSAMPLHPMIPPPGLQADLRDAYEAQLDEAVARLRETAPEVRGLLRVGDAAREVLAAAHEVSADLIVVGTHGRSGLSRFILGSTAEYIVRHAEVPVLTVRSPAPAHTRRIGAGDSDGA